LHHLHRSSKQVSLQIAEELLHLAERQQDAAAQAAAHRCLAVSMLFHGNLPAAWTHCEEALALYDPDNRTFPVSLVGTDIRVACLCFMALILLLQGYPEQALARNREAFAAGAELNHVYTTSQALYLTCWLHQILGDRQVVQERATELIALSTEHSLLGWLPHGTIFHGWAIASGGAAEAGIAELRQGLAEKEGRGILMHTPGMLGLLAGLHLGIKNAGEALGLIDEALARVDRFEERWFEADLRRLRGETLLARSPEHSVEAEICYHRALAIARAQSAHLCELRVATGLARLWRDQNKRTEARDLLAPVYGWFTEGFETADLKDARALLDELR
jgi:predicted ATPase